MPSLFHSFIRTFTCSVTRRYICQTTVLGDIDTKLDVVETARATVNDNVRLVSLANRKHVRSAGISLVDKKLYKSRTHLMKWLTSNVIYEDENILALTKPSGTPVFGSGNTEVSEDAASDVERPVTLFNLLPELRDSFSSPHLEIALGNPRYHSGVVLLSKSDEVRRRVEKCVNTAQTQKLTHLKYVAVTNGIPQNLKKGPEEMGFTRRKFEERVMTVRVETWSKSRRQSGEEILSVFNTGVMVINERLSTALLHLHTNKAKWDCIETYMTEKLCSVLGDHLYSGRVNTVLGVPVHVEPSMIHQGAQNLPSSLLRRLKVHESDLPYLPLHLHRHQVELYNFPSKKSGTLVVTAPLPDYFQASMDKLQLNP